MAYVPDWERLPEALKRVMAAGVPEDEAKLDISRQIADGKIRVRLTIAEQSVPTTTKVFADWNQLVAEAQGLAPRTPHQKTNNQEGSVESNECFEDANVKVPPHLTPADFDWENSRPVKSWPIGPRDWKSSERHSLSWNNRTISLIEVRTADVTARIIATGSEELNAGKGPLKKSQRPRSRRRPAFERAQGAIKKLYRGSFPDQAAEPNVSLCRKVGAKLKEDTLPGVSDDTILRAAGRRRK